ncbi:DMT family transporter [Orbus wheelerorum]|uniref:DMT family transporter n=1 Tax=Orbus wheelerorum TaxID=3074111 RepID=UPI00370D67E7
MKQNMMIGGLFALMAALLNACIGIISLLLINSGLSSEAIAFLKTVLAYILVTLILIKIPNHQQKNIISTTTNSKRLFIKMSICAFLGIFILFFFETMAYSFSYSSPANVVVILMSSAAVSALFVGYLILNEKLFVSTILGAMLAIIGVSIISWQGTINVPLLLNASIAGVGYGLFTVLIKKFKLNGGIYLTKYLLLFGSFYLFLPFIIKFDFDIAGKLNLDIFMGILFLAVLPTICGFYCTTKALKYLSAGNVQVTELSEPIFSALLTVIFFGTMPNNAFYIGALFIILGLVLINQLFKRHG